MTKFYIEYNPYLEKCIFKMNGKDLCGKKSNSKFKAKVDTRLQILLGESINWKGLFEEIAIACDDDEIGLLFKGRRIDYEDLSYALNLYKGDAIFDLSFEEATNDNDVVRALDNIIQEIKEKDIPEFNQKDEDGKDIFTAYEEVKNGIFEVSVIATMSSGKSTLLNALMHTELLPSENAACTATVARIFDNDDMNTYEAECYAEDKQTIIYPRTVVNLDDMKKYNADEKVAYIDIEGNIPAISSENIKLCLRDTPGPNNSRNENHERLTQQVIKQENTIILYVMNATQQEINDDKMLLQTISDEMKRKGKESRDRFIFVLNKCDNFDVEKGETIEKALDKTREYLKQFGIIDPILIPTSARLALLIHKRQKGEHLSSKEEKELILVKDYVDEPLLHYEDYATLTPAIKDYLKEKVCEYHARNEIEAEALIHSGIPVVEEVIREYVEKYAYPMKIKDSVTDIIKILEELDMKNKFVERIAKDEDELQRVRKQIAQAQEKQADSKRIRTEFKSQINKLSIDEPSEDEEQFKVEMELQRMTKQYDGKTKVDKVEADYLVKNFLDELEKFQRSCENNLNRQIDQKIYQRCQEMLEQYKELVTDILGEIEIDGYDFDKIASFDKIRISNIDDIKRKNQSTRYRDERRWKDNPKRAGFWGIFKFWEPKEVSYTVQVKDGVDVNVKNIIVDIMSQFAKSIKENIHSMFIQANAQVEEYQNTFNNNIDRLSAEIDRLLQEVKESTSLGDGLQSRVENNKKLAVWVAQEENKIYTLLSF